MFVSLLVCYAEVVYTEYITVCLIKLNAITLTIIFRWPRLEEKAYWLYYICVW